jgi:hypothetical protein
MLRIPSSAQRVRAHNSIWDVGKILPLKGVVCNRILVELSTLETAFLTRLIPDDEKDFFVEDSFLQNHVDAWKQDARLVALGDHCLISEDSPEIIVPEADEEERGDEITNPLSPQAHAINRAI